MSLLDQGGGVDGPGEVLRDVDPQKPKTGDTLSLRSFDAEGGVRVTFRPPVVHDHLFCLLGVEGQVVV
jgi:hypothetical protein